MNYYRAVTVCGITVLAGLLSAVSPAESQQPTFSSRVEATRIDVLVTRDKRPVHGLTPANFVLTDNKVPQTVELISFDEVPVNVVLALDLSSSLSAERLGRLRKACGMFLDSLKASDKAALVTFNETVVIAAPLTESIPTVRTAVQRAEALPGTSATALFDGIFAALQAAETDVGRALVVVFSDGVDTGSWLTAGDITELAKRSDAVVYAVTTPNLGRTDFLKDLVHDTGGSQSEVEWDSDLDAAFVGVLDEFRHRYLLSYTPQGVDRTGWHAVTVRLKGVDARIKSRSGYWSGN